MKLSTNLLFLLLFILTMFDLAATSILMDNGAIEKNIVVLWLLNNFGWTGAVIQKIIFILIAYIFFYISKYKQKVIPFIYVTTICFGIVSIYHIVQIMRL